MGGYLTPAPNPDSCCSTINFKFHQNLVKIFFWQLKLTCATRAAKNIDFDTLTNSQLLLSSNWKASFRKSSLIATFLMMSWNPKVVFSHKWESKVEFLIGQPSKFLLLRYRRKFQRFWLKFIFSMAVELINGWAHIDTLGNWSFSSFTTLKVVRGFRICRHTNI